MHVKAIEAAFHEKMGEAGARLRLAAQWLFDSYATRSQLLSYVQATVVLEILLGEKAQSDLIGLGALLANRCAYLIGRDSDERAEILETFNRSYALRSAIVHRGKDGLVGHEVDLFHQLRSFCARVLLAELRLLEKTLRRDVNR